MTTQVGPNTWRVTCCVCGKPMSVHTLALAERTDIECSECRERLPDEVEKEARL